MGAKTLAPELEERVELHRQPARLVPPIFEEGTAGPEKLFWDSRIETAKPREEDERVASESGNRNRVELEIAEVADDRSRRLAGSGTTPLGSRRKMVPARLVKPSGDQGQTPGLTNADPWKHGAMLSVNRRAALRQLEWRGGMNRGDFGE